MINRPYLSSIAFRLPFAIALICVLVFSLAAIAVYGLQRAREEMAAYGLQAFSSLAKASLVSRQVSDLVSSAPFLMNATSTYRVSSESRSVVAQVDTLLRTMQPEDGDKTVRGFASARITRTTLSCLRSLRKSSRSTSVTWKPYANTINTSRTAKPNCMDFQSEAFFLVLLRSFIIASPYPLSIAAINIFEFLIVNLFGQTLKDKLPRVECHNSICIAMDKIKEVQAA